MADGYHLNLHGQTSRSSGRRSTFAFGAASEGAAATVAAEIANWTADQQTSLTKNVFSDYRAINAGYPAGSFTGMTAIVWDATEGAWRVRFRNIYPLSVAVDMAQSLNALLTGTAYTPVAVGSIAALSAPPSLPNGGLDVAYVTSINVLDKP